MTNVGVTLALKRLRKIVDEAVGIMDSLLQSLPDGELRAHATGLAINLLDASWWLTQCEEYCKSDRYGGENDAQA